MVTVRNKFDILQETSETHTPNNKYENFITNHMQAAAVAECIWTKPRAKCRVTWESLVVRKKWDSLKRHPYPLKETEEMPMHKNMRKPNQQISKEQLE